MLPRRRAGVIRYESLLGILEKEKSKSGRQVEILSLRRSAANEPNDNASTQNQLERLKFEKDSEKDTGIKEKTYLE